MPAVYQSSLKLLRNWKFNSALKSFNRHSVLPKKTCKTEAHVRQFNVFWITAFWMISVFAFFLSGVCFYSLSFILTLLTNICKSNPSVWLMMCVRERKRVHKCVLFILFMERSLLPFSNGKQNSRINKMFSVVCCFLHLAIIYTHRHTRTGITQYNMINCPYDCDWLKQEILICIALS